MADTETAPVDLGPDTGALTLEQATNRGLAKRSAPPAPESEDQPVPGADAEVESPEGEGEPTEAVTETEENSEADTQAADEGEGDPETDTSEAEEAQDADPPKGTLEAPARWDAEGKALFATLPVKAQEFLISREKQQQAEVTKAQQKSAEATKQIETRIKHLDQLTETIGEYVDSGTARMQWWSERMTAWDDWFASDEALETARENPAEYAANEARYRQEMANANREKRQLEKAKADKEALQRQAFEAFAKEQGELLPQIAPELVDPKEGKQRWADTMTYLHKAGVPADQIKGISALEAAIAFKAKKHDDLVAKFADKGGLDALIRDAELYRKASKAVKNPPPPKPKSAGPTAPTASGGSQTSSDEARFKSLNSKRSLSFNEGVELGELKRKLGK